MRTPVTCEHCGRPSALSIGQTKAGPCLCVLLPETRGFDEDWQDRRTLTLDVVDLGHNPMPVFKQPDGSIDTITGEAAADWPNPKMIMINGHYFIEQPLHGTWGATYHHGPSGRRTPLGEFIRQYSEGIASGFPRWPVVVFALRAAWRRVRRGA